MSLYFSIQFLIQFVFNKFNPMKYKFSAECRIDCYTCVAEEQVLKDQYISEVCACKAATGDTYISAINACNDI